MNPAAKPIIFSGPMVLAVLEGRKTQTRRIVKPQPEKWNTAQRAPFTLPHEPRTWSPLADNSDDRVCPYELGAELWVRESWSIWDKTMTRIERESLRIPTGPNGLMPGSEGYWKRRVIYRCDGDPDPVNPWMWYPSIFMPRWASRITLEVTGVRVERLNEISEADAKAEGVEPWSFGPYQNMTTGEYGATYPYRGGFACVWDELQEAHTWKSNPWVWVYEFRKVEE
jgi:hypothetical protein